MILLIDNYDSFTFNLYQYLGELGEELKVVRNDQITAEVRDLKEGLEMIEEKARFELGMVKPDEIYVQVSTAKR